MTVLSHLGGGLLGCSVWLPQVSQWSGLRAPQMRTHWRNVIFFENPYKCPAFARKDSLDTKPVTGSLHFSASGCRLADFIAEGLVLCASRDSAEFLLTIVCRALRIFLWHCSDTEMLIWILLSLRASDSSGRLGLAFQVAGSGCRQSLAWTGLFAC